MVRASLTTPQLWTVRQTALPYPGGPAVPARKPRFGAGEVHAGP